MVESRRGGSRSTSTSPGWRRAQDADGKGHPTAWEPWPGWVGHESLDLAGGDIIMQRWLLSLAVLMGLLALASCASEEKATPAPSPTAATRPAWEQEWDRVVEAAKKEGKVTLAAPLGDAVRKALTEPFEKRYGITVEYQGFS